MPDSMPSPSDDPASAVQRQLFLRSLAGANASPTLTALISRGRSTIVSSPRGGALRRRRGADSEIFFVFKGEVELGARGTSPGG